MISIYKSKHEGLEEEKKYERDTWINIVNPTKEELIKIEEELNIPVDFLTDPLDANERSRSEIEKNYILVVLRIPLYDEKDEATPFITLPIGIILTRNLIITICSQKNNVISDFINGRVKNFSTMKRDRFALQIFLRTSLLYLRYLKEISDKAADIQKELHKAMKNEELIKLLNLEKSLVYFTTSLKSNELMMERLQKTNVLRMGTEEEELIEDVIIENKQAIEMANIYSNILSGMMDAYASIISNNLNVVMKFLTAITIVLMIPTLVASLYGMNVNLPFQHSRYAFLLVIIISLFLSGMWIGVFVKRRWF